MFAAAAVAGPARKRVPCAPAHRVVRAVSLARLLHPVDNGVWLHVLAVLAGAVLALPAGAQSLNWEGVAGGVVTPFAATATPGGITRPTIAFHLLNGGDIIGRRYQGSFTFGFGNRLEVGYTRSSVTSSDAYERLLFDRGFNTFHGKVNLLTEAEGTGARPAISAGVQWRWQAQHLEDGLGVATKNADVYLVATRWLPVSEQLTLLLDLGAKLSNASLMGIAGNAPDWRPLVFGAAGARFGGVLAVGAEYLQEPEEVDGMPGAKLPATLAYFARLTPAGGRLGIDLALIRAAGEIMPGFNADAEHRLLLGVSYALHD